MSVPAATQPLIVAIDPADANTVYFRVVGALTDSIWITTNGGQTFDTQLEHQRAVLRSFSGRPTAPCTSVNWPGCSTSALRERPTGPATPRRTSAASASAPESHGSTPAATWESMASAWATATTDGATFHAMMNFTDLLGPLTCARGASNCQAHWERIQGVLGIAPAPDGGTDAGPADGGQWRPTDAGRPPTGELRRHRRRGTTKSGCSATDGDAGSLRVLITALVLWEFRRRRRGH